VRNWNEEDLTQFAAMAGKLKALVRKTNPPCFARSWGLKPCPPTSSRVSEKFSGQSIDGVFAVGKHLMLRNSQGWYGDPKQIPFVTEKRGGGIPESLAFWLLHITPILPRTTYPLADYQHL